MAWHVTIWLLCLQVFLAETALSVRTWAIWSRSKIIGFGLVALNLAHLIIECVFLHKIFSLLQFGVRPYQGFRGCVLTQNSNWEWVNFATVALVEAVVLFLMLISAFRLYREGSQSELTDVIHRDGIIFYVYLLILAVANMTNAIVLPMDLIMVLTPIQNMMYSVLTSRIFLNIRIIRNLPDLQGELHSIRNHFPGLAIPLHEFCHSEDRSV